MSPFHMRLSRSAHSLSLLGLTCALLAVAACSGKSKADKLYDQGMLFFKNRSFYNAIEKFEAALKLQPDNVPTLVRCADANLKINKPEQAILYGERALAKNPDLDEASLIVGEAHLELALSGAKEGKDGKPILDAAHLAEAGRISTQLRARKPDSIEATVLDARIDYFSDKWNDAERLFRAALAKEPANDNARVGLIDLLMARKDYVEAEVTARKALEAVPKDTAPNPAYIGQLASSLMYQKRFDDAYKVVEPYLAPENKTPVLLLYATAGQVLLTQLQSLGRSVGDAGAVEDAVATTGTQTVAMAADTSATLKVAVDRLAKLGGQMKGIWGALSESWFYRGLSYELLGDMPKAIQHYQEAVTRSPSVKRYRLVLALAQMKTGNLVQAQQEISNLLKFSPGDFDGRLVMAATKIADGSIDDALTLLRALQLEQPDNTRVLQMLARQLVVSGDPAKIEEGLKFVNRLGELHALGDADRTFIHASALFSEGLALARQKKTVEAVEKLTEAEKGLKEVVVKQPANAQAEMLLSELAESRQDLFSALAHARRAAAIDPRLAVLEAQVYLNLGQLDPAAEIYRRQIEKNPEATGNVLALAEIDLRRNKSDEAIKSLDALIARRGSDFRLYINKSRAQALLDQPDAAMATLSEARKKIPDEPALPIEMSRIEMKRNRVPQAIALLAESQKAAVDQLTLKRAQGQSDNDQMKRMMLDLASLDLELATAELFGGMFDASAVHANQSQEVSGSPSYQTAVIGAIALFGKGQPAAAAEAIDKAGALIKGQPAASAMIQALALTAAGKQAEALALMGKTAGMDPDTRDFFERLLKTPTPDQLSKAGAAVSLQLLMDGAGIYASAVNDQCDAALKIIPDDPFVLTRKAATLRLLGQSDEALKIYDRLMQLLPGNAAIPTVETEVYLARAAQAIASGNAQGGQEALAKAADMARKGMELASKNPAAISRMALILQNQAKLDEANDLYRKLIEIDPGNWTAYNNLAWNLAQAGKLDEALGIADKALKAAPAGGPIRGSIQDTAGWIQLQKGDTSKALELLDQAVVNDPNNAEVRMHLAEAFQKAGQSDKAALQLEAIVSTTPGFSRIGEVRELLRQVKPGSDLLKPTATGA